MVCRPKDKYCNSRDGFPIITKEELAEIEFEYLIISCPEHFEEIKNEALECGVKRVQIIDGQKFLLPLFDFRRYAQLIQNPVTILSDDCWGGYVYKRLGLEFSSPLINIFWDRREYSKFIQDPSFYLGTELTVIRDGNLKMGVPPIGQLGDANRTVQLHFVHNIDFAEAKMQRKRRMKRINLDNKFVKMGFVGSDEGTDKYIEAFEKCRYPKNLFYNGDDEIDGIFKTERFM